MRRAASLLLVAAFFLQLCACRPPHQEDDPHTADTPAVSESPSPTPRPTPTPVATPKPTETPEPSPTPTPEPPTPTPVPTPRPPAVPYSEEALEKQVQTILGKIITEDMTKRQQAKAVYNYVRGNIVYVGTSEKTDWRQGAYTGFTTRRGDCFTFYAAVRVLLTALDIDNIEVQRDGGRSHHYWSLVNCGDGWYHLDATPRSTKLPSFDSFLFTDEEATAFSEASGMSYYQFDHDLYPRTGTNDPIPGTEEPEESEAPEETETPVDPENPETSTTPEDPEASATPENPEASTTPENPEASATPEDPEASATPEDPEASAAPEDPEASAAPEGPDIPEPPAAPEEPDGQAPPAENGAGL